MGVASDHEVSTKRSRLATRRADFHASWAAVSPPPQPTYFLLPLNEKHAPRPPAPRRPVARTEGLGRGSGGRPTSASPRQPASRTPTLERPLAELPIGGRPVSPKSERHMGAGSAGRPRERCIGSALVGHAFGRALQPATRKAALARTVEVVSSAKRTRSDVAYGRIPPGAEPFMAGTGSDETTRISWMQKPALSVNFPSRAERVWAIARAPRLGRLT